MPKDLIFTSTEKTDFHQNAVLNPLGSWWTWGLQEEAMKDVFPCNLVLKVAPL